ncbi:MAG: hypothetical protein EXQ88_04395 [Alphaproteobacteria bacterium]|nr:hypothetical protein [Alphaproteobacteria bacterium]
MDKALDPSVGTQAARVRVLLASSALALVFVVTPAGLELGAGGLSLVANRAQAKNDGDHGNAGGNGGGNYHAAAAADHGIAGGNGGGKDFGANISADKGKPSVTGQDKKDEHGAATVAYTFSQKESDLLLSNGWAAHAQGNHGATVSTYVHIAKALGFSVRDGALQANFMPADWYSKKAELRGIDSQVAALQVKLDSLPDALAAAQNVLDAANDALTAANALPSATSDEQTAKAAAIDAANAAITQAQAALDALPTAEELQAQIDALADQLDALKSDLDALANSIPDWKPGNGPLGDEWATVNLDWNGDGVVDQQDVDAKNAGLPPAEVYLPTL